MVAGILKVYSGEGGLQIFLRGLSYCKIFAKYLLSVRVCGEKTPACQKFYIPAVGFYRQMFYGKSGSGGRIPALGFFKFSHFFAGKSQNLFKGVFVRLVYDKADTINPGGRNGFAAHYLPR